MLVLTRRVGQSIVIGDSIEVVISQVKGAGTQAQVRVAISAPQGVRVLRKEVLDEVVAENRLASQAHVDLEQLDALCGAHRDRG